MIATEPLVDVLPERDGQRMGLRWFPGPVYPECGVLEIAGKRDATSYAVVSLPTDWPGRAFHFEKVTGEGTDATEPGYAVFCTGDPAAEPDHCPCKGFSRHRHCKHVDAARTLVANGWL